jgi:hypothetical protein
MSVTVTVTTPLDLFILGCEQIMIMYHIRLKASVRQATDILCRYMSGVEVAVDVYLTAQS